VNRVSRPLALVLPPLGLAVAGALAVLLAGGLHWTGVLLALGVLGAGAGVARHQTHLHGELTRSIDRYLAGEQQFSQQVAPIWSGHIESSRVQMEGAVESLTRRFSAIVSQLDAAVQTASARTDADHDGDQGLRAVFSRSEHELGAVITAQRRAHASMANMLDKVQGLERFATDLQDMATDVAKISQQSNLLALNAAIEAARFGDQGRGFAVVAKEFRTLSSLSGETGRRIDDKVGVIKAAIGEACGEVGELVRQEDGAMDESRACIGRVLADFRHVTDSLQHASSQLREESLGIKAEVGEALVQLQFQDRVSQMMNHVKANIDRLPAYYQGLGQQYAERGELAALDTEALLGELKRTYAMEDQHVIHAGETVTQAGDTEITFF
jgi:methyl-accepting chemotaxis protein